MNTAIAQHLNVTESAIIEVQEWARVLWVRVKGLGARFVSKKVVKMEVVDTGAVVQICEDDGEYTLLHQMPHGTVLDDGRVQFKTPRGMGFLVSKDACQDLGLDPNKAVFDASMSNVHYKLNQPMGGKVVRAYVSQSCEAKINPAWAAYNNGMNEGGEGYNPYPKHVVTKKSSTRYL
jgi:hypothetical protein